MNGISGTFKQNGKEYDAARFARRIVTEVAQIRCECGSPMTQYGKATDDLLVCFNRECKYLGIIYRVHRSRVTLEAVEMNSE